MLISLLMVLPVRAATYFVRTDGNNGNAGTSNTSGGAWLTIDFAAGAASNGDIVRVQAGTYAERITPNVNGVTFIADGLVILDGIDFSDGNNGMRWIDDFRFDPATTGAHDNGCITVDGTVGNMEFWGCTFTNGAANGFRGVGTDVLTNSLIIGCRFVDFGTELDPGSAVAFSTPYLDLLFMANEIENSRPDGVAMFGRRARYLNNYVHGLSESEGGHTDVFQTGSPVGNAYGWFDHLFEGTFYVAGQLAPDEHVAQLSNGQGGTEAFGNAVYRRNVWHSTGSGGIGVNQTDTGSISNIYVFNNSYIEACRGIDNTSTRYGDTFYGTMTDFIYYKNNLLWEAWGEAVSASLEVILFDVVSTYESDYNLAYDPDGAVTFHSLWSNQANEQSNVNPNLVDKDNDDFRLGASSGAQNTGGPLTLVNETSGSGTTFTVDNAGYFRGDATTFTQYGGNLIVGDTITVGTDVVTIVSISGNDLTVTPSITWADNDPVYFGSDATPDIGAYPFGVTLLSAATISAAGNDYTVIPTGTARLVVFFQDGIPHTVDNSSPYTATIASGAVTAKAYALYAQEVPVVNAAGDAPPGGGATFNVTGTVGVGTLRVYKNDDE